MKGSESSSDMQRIIDENANRIIYNEAVVIGIVYPGVEAYLNDYFKSLDEQLFKDFDVIIYNDGLDSKKASIYPCIYENLNIRIIDVNGKYTPAQIREYAILNAKLEYHYLIFTDADDYISHDRINKSIEYLYKYDFCYNNMYLIDEKSNNIHDYPYFKNKSNPRIVNDFKDLLTRNFCGLSNTAINLMKLDFSSFQIPSDIIAVDWWLFSYLLINGYVGYYIEDTYTYYRQHSQNTVGASEAIDEKQILKGIDVKLLHYEKLLEYIPSKYDADIREELYSIIGLKSRIKDKDYFNSYIDAVNSSDKEYMWWESIRIL